MLYIDSTYLHQVLIIPILAINRFGGSVSPGLDHSYLGNQPMWSLVEGLTTRVAAGRSIPLQSHVTGTCLLTKIFESVPHNVSKTSVCPLAIRARNQDTGRAHHAGRRREVEADAARSCRLRAPVRMSGYELPQKCQVTSTHENVRLQIPIRLSVDEPP